MKVNVFYKPKKNVTVEQMINICGFDISPYVNKAKNNLRLIIHKDWRIWCVDKNNIWIYSPGGDRFYLTNHNDILVRVLTEDDTEQVKILDKEADQNLSELLDSYEYVWGIFKDGMLIGYCSIGKLDYLTDYDIKDYVVWTENSLIISNVYILDAYRRKGFGLTLIKEVLANHSEIKDNAVCVFVDLLNPNLSYFYEKAGFKILENNEYTMVYSPSNIKSDNN